MIHVLLSISIFISSSLPEKLSADCACAQALQSLHLALWSSMFLASICHLGRYLLSAIFHLLFFGSMSIPIDGNLILWVTVFMILSQKRHFSPIHLKPSLFVLKAPYFWPLCIACIRYTDLCSRGSIL